jgi:hypothetical protein
MNSPSSNAGTSTKKVICH